MELNREQIIKALECCTCSERANCADCPYDGDELLRPCDENLMQDAFALIGQYEQKIFELENRLKECENGYAGTLALERAKVKELTEEVESLEFEHEHSDLVIEGKLKRIQALEKKVLELTEENERLMRDKTALECIVSTARNQARADTVREITKRFTEVLKLSLAADNEAFVPVSAVARALAIASAGEEFGGGADGEKPLL